ncbi:MAG: TRAP transporter substrate-binding protein [Syntrophorhabdaceae bacterium]|nr:TRAP transporter substrate-binding protein [Syntrophorhabdaceae bacterium]MDD4195021.1 TRAP transporter substrate-binding protein [Syntrophorhabdaceae bacterium]
MKRFVVSVFLVFFLAVTFCLVSVSASAQVKLRFSTFFPVSHPNAQLTAEWCKEVEKRTQGKVKVQHFPGATLTSPQQTYDSILSGVVDIGNCVLGYTMGKFPLSEILDYPLGYPSGVVATRLVNEFYKQFKPKEFDDVKVMFFHAQGPGILHTRKPVKTLEDLKGMKIRTFGSNAKMMSMLGGSPVAMPMGDAYDALSKGVADGLLCGYEALKGWKLGEVIKSTSENYGTAYTATFVIAMNKAKWNGIPPDSQKIIEQINQEFSEKQGKLWDKMDQDGKEFSIKRGNQVIKLSAEENAKWVAKIEPLFNEYVKKTKEKNLPGDKALKFTRDYIKKNTK